jgi:hypothetical protein
MDILIKGMEMPTTCAVCEWSRYAFPNSWCDRMRKMTDIEIAKNGRPDDCPLVPAIDIMPVVRCKDCKHWRLIKDDCFLAPCDLDWVVRSEDFFCAYGDRRDNND